MKKGGGSVKKRKKIGDLLLEAGLITKEQLEKALQEQKNSNMRLGDMLISQGLITEQQVIKALEKQLGIPHVRLTNDCIDRQTIALLPGKVAKQHAAIPLRIENGKLITAMADPLDVQAIDEISLHTGLRIEPVIASKKEILHMVRRHYELHEMIDQITWALSGEKHRHGERSQESPVIYAVNQLIGHAVELGASDIHLDPQADGLYVRYRIDGLLRTEFVLPLHLHAVMAARMKIMGDMDVAEKRLPQDGRMNLMIDDRNIDIRIASLPTIYGEKIVMRLLDLSQSISDLNGLNMTSENLAMFKKAINQPNGAVIITGPTGSGKSTTLYAALSELNQDEVNLITIEDPVEYRIPGVNQVQVNPAAGLTFASGLRSILRQDPNIIMVGEIRDRETAEISIRAALTGHLVLSTLHTNNAVNTITRLIDMGVEPFLAASALNCVVAQRLVRKICTNCKISYAPGADELILLEQHEIEAKELFRGAGCYECGQTGFKGRMAVHEVLLLDDEMRALIMQKKSDSEYMAHALRKGMVPMIKDGFAKAVQGCTTIDQVMRVTSN